MTGGFDEVVHRQGGEDPRRLAQPVAGDRDDDGDRRRREAAPPAVHDGRVPGDVDPLGQDDDLVERREAPGQFPSLPQPGLDELRVVGQDLPELRRVGILGPEQQALHTRHRLSSGLQAAPDRRSQERLT